MCQQTCSTKSKLQEQHANIPVLLTFSETIVQIWQSDDRIESANYHPNSHLTEVILEMKVTLRHRDAAIGSRVYIFQPPNIYRKTLLATTKNANETLAYFDAFLSYDASKKSCHSWKFRACIKRNSINNIFIDVVY